MVNRTGLAGSKTQRGYTLTEAMITIVIILILAAMVGPSFRGMLQSFSHREETSRVEMIIRKTIAEGIAQGTATRISIAGNTIAGQVSSDRTGINFDPIPNLSYSLKNSSFVRENAEPTPWLANAQAASLTYSDPGIPAGSLSFSQFGLPAQGGTVFVQYGKDITGVIEILASGDIRVYRWEDGEWSR